MTTEGFTHHHADQSRFRFDVQPINVDGGWSGRVLTRCKLPGGVKPVMSAIASVQDWQAALSVVVSNPTTLAGHTMLKESRNGQVFRARISLPVGSMEIICKQSTARGRLRGFLQHFRTPREPKTFDRAFVLLGAGISTALPLAVLERKWPQREAWLITQAIPDTVDLERVMSGLLWELEPARLVSVKRALLQELVGLCRRMAEHRLYHRDLKASNILVSDWDSVKPSPRVWLVDLDGVRLRSRPNPQAEWRGIMRLAASLVGYRASTRTDALRFLRAYLASDHRSKGAWKFRWRQIAREVTRYNRRSRRRKRGKLDGFAGD